jgi:DNA-binding CsgD family transcriptional regulator
MCGMEEAAFSQILDAIYDSATTFERWPVTLERIGGAFGCNCSALIDRNLRTMDARTTCVGLDAGGQSEFLQTWSKHDILRQRTPVYRPGAVETDRGILPKSELLRSDYYNGFMKPHDMHAVMRVTLSVDNQFRKIISLSRPMLAGDYDTADVEQCSRLVPHLRRAASITQHVEESNVLLNAFSDVLEQSATGVLLLDWTGRILFANRGARVMAQPADGFRLRSERIEALNNPDDAALQRLIGGATGRIGQAEAARGGVMRLSRKSGKPDFTIVAAPLASETSWTEAGAVAFVLIADPETAAIRPLEMAGQLFGLSAAETRVAERLMMGDSPEQAAEILDIKTSTARWHLASLYRKTGTRGQVQLVRLLLSLPTV